MNSETINGKLAALCATLALAISAQAQEEETKERAEPEQLELISIDDLPSAAADESDDEEEFLVTQPSQRESSLEELRRSFELYKSAIANASYNEADTLAKRMVELTIRLYGLDSHESAKALTNLGRVQYKNKDFEPAILNFTASIDIIERIEDRLNTDLINPLRGLGAAQLGSGRPDLARAAFRRAVHISQVNEGPHNLMQIRVLEELAETYLTMGDTDKALDIHQFIYNLEARNTDLDSEAIIPALERQAQWTHRMRMHERERMTWRKIIGILEDSRGKKDLSLIPPLTGLGNSYLFISDYELETYGGGSMSSGDTYLKRAVRISSENPDGTWQLQGQTLLALGDYYMLSNRANKARRIYQDTWDLLSSDAEREEARTVLLETPNVLQSIQPPRYYNSKQAKTENADPNDFLVGRIVVAYNISSRGSTRDITIVEAEPAGLEDMEYSVVRELGRLIYRPRMEGGAAVATPGQTYTHDFFYRPSDLPAKTEEQADETVSAEDA
jgi:tetratricopeptide repeat protein